MRTYFLNRMRGFANEYRICVATGPAAVTNYLMLGYERIPRAEALRRLAYDGPGLQARVAVEIDGEPEDPKATLRALRRGCGEFARLPAAAGR